MGQLKSIPKAVVGRETTACKNAVRKLDRDQTLELLYRLELGVSNTCLSGTPDTSYPYIPFSHSAFYSSLMGVKKEGDQSFLEIGCGVGTKLYIAEKFAGIPHVTGLEINHSLAAIAREFLKEDPDYGAADIREGDAMTFDFYGEYDLIYAYTPFRGRPQNQALYDKIMAQMKPGARFLRAMFGQNSCEVFTKDC